MRSRKRQRGFDLIQLGLVVALIGMLMSGALVGVPRLIDSIKTGQQVDDLRVFITQVQGSAALYSTGQINANVLHALEVYPFGKGTVSGEEIQYPGRFNTPVRIARVAKFRSMTITVEPSTTFSCQKITREIGPLARDISIGQSTITKQQDGFFDSKQIADQCAIESPSDGSGGTGATRSIIFTVDI